MSVCTFIASDYPLAEIEPSQDYLLDINIDNGTVYDDGADDNYSLRIFTDVESYTKREMLFIWNGTIQMAGRSKLLNI